MRTTGYAIAACVMASALALPAAAQVTYTITGFSDVTNGPQSATFTVADYLRGDGVIIPTSAFASCVSAQTCIEFEYYEHDPFNGSAYSLLSFRDDSTGTFYYFDKTAFVANGIYNNAQVGFNLATLIVSGAAVGAVPEPAAWAMMIAGFGMIGAVARRRTVVLTFG